MIMNNLDKALMEFWGGFGIPAFANYAFLHDDTGRRTRPKFPYITYELKRPAFFKSTIMNASVWDRQEASPGFRGRTNEILKRIEQAVPEGGVTLKFDGGSVWISRTSNFIEYPQNPDPDDAYIVRAVVGVEVRGFIT